MQSDLSRAEPNDRPRVTVIGSLPPPITGQNIQAQRNAHLLSQRFDVAIVDLSTGSNHPNSVLSLGQRVLHYATRRQSIRTSIRDRVPDAIVWHSISPTIAGHLRDRFVVTQSIPRSIPVYAVVHWGNFDQLFRRSILASSARRIVRRVTLFVFLAESLSERCCRWIPDEKRTVIPNVVDEVMVPGGSKITAKLDRGLGSDPRQWTILFVSNMIREKGYMELLKSIPALLRSGHDVRARFVGSWASDADADAFQATSRQLGIDHCVRHDGLISDREALAQLFLEADVVALPTWYPVEAQPLVVIEALASATPVVVSRHAALPSMVVAGKEARFIDPHDEESIAAGIADLIRPATWRLAAANARLRYDERYAHELIERRWFDLLNVARPSSAS